MVGMKNIAILSGALCAWVFCTATLFADMQMIDGQKWVCRDGMCIMVDSPGEEQEPAAVAVPATPPRLAHGWMGADEFIAFIENREVNSFAGKAWWLIVLIALVGGLAMNFTPCVLPMIPVNLMIIGRSARRGALYGAGIAVAYGICGVLAAVGGMAFGAVQGSAWFNASIAVLFLVLGLSMTGVFFIDFSGMRGKFAALKSGMWPGLFAFFMGMVCAILAGACVAPVLIAVLLLTADLFSKGIYYALALPFVLGIGMALPWPLAGAGLKVMPKPGNWMKKVNLVFAAVVFAFAIWYGYLAWTLFRGDEGSPRTEASSAVSFDSPEDFSLAGLKRPVLVDCWASWCKNCTAMDRTTLQDPRVKNALAEKGVTFVKLRAEDIARLKKLPGFENVLGLPAFLVFE